MLNETGRTGVQVNLTPDGVTGVVTQDSESTLSTPGGLATSGTVADLAMGQEFTLIARCGIDTNSPAASTTYTVDYFSKNAPFKFRVLEVMFEVIDLTVAEFTDADAGNLDVTVQDGDGAEAETFTDVLADFALDDDYANGKGARFPTAAVVLTNTTIEKNESLRAQLIVDPDAVAGGTNDGALVDIMVRCIRVN